MSSATIGKVRSATTRRAGHESGVALQHSAEIDASAALLYSLVADIEMMARLSPECVDCRFIGGATRAVEGARFRGRSRRGRHRWTTTSVIVEAVPGRRISWDVTYFTRPVARWTYEFVETERGRTNVTERCVDLRRAVLRRTSWLITGSWDRATRNRATMHTTLQRLAMTAESPSAHGGGDEDRPRTAT